MHTGGTQYMLVEGLIGFSEPLPSPLCPAHNKQAREEVGLNESV